MKSTGKEKDDTSASKRGPRKKRAPLLKSSDIPQSASLEQLRQLLKAVAAGNTTKLELTEKAQFTPRHIDYRFHAARVLCLLDGELKGMKLTSLGESFLRTVPDSPNERHVFREALEKSVLMKVLAPDLLTLPESHFDAEVRARLQEKARLSVTTARDRAQTLWSWRQKALETRPEGTSLSVPDARPVRPPPQMPLEGRLNRSATHPSVKPAAPEPQGETKALEALKQGGHALLKRVAVRGFGGIKELSLDVGRFHLLTGEHGSGRSTFLDALMFVSDCCTVGLEQAVQQRGTDMSSLTFHKQDANVVFTFDLEVRPNATPGAEASSLTARYVLEIGLSSGDEAEIFQESLDLYSAPRVEVGGKRRRIAQSRRILERNANRMVSYRSEDGRWEQPPFQQASSFTALAQVPNEQDRFMATRIVREFFTQGVRRLSLEPRVLRQPSPLQGPEQLGPAGENLARVVQQLKNKQPREFDRWLAQVKVACPPVERVEILRSRALRQCSLTAQLKGGTVVPFSRLSDGTLRLLTLLLVPFVAAPGQLLLLEDPEVGLNARALEQVKGVLLQPLPGQLLIVTQSSTLSAAAEPAQLISFAWVGDQVKVQTAAKPPAPKPEE